MQKDREDSTKYHKIHRQATTSLAQLKKDITTAGLESTLKLYVANKDLELSNSKFSCKKDHIQKVNAIYDAELDHWKEMLHLSYQLVQQLYLLLRSFDRIDTDMEESVKKLVKMCAGRQKIVKFLEECAVNKDTAELSFTGCDSPQVSSANKRALEDPTTQSSLNKIAKVVNTFAKPKAVKSINFNNGGAPVASKVNSNVFKVPAPAAPAPKLNTTHTIESHNLNSTFDLTTATNVTPKFTNILREPAVMNRIMKQGGVATKGPLNKGTTASTAMLNKENKRSKTPNKFPVKSPKKVGKGPVLNGVHKARMNLKPLNPNTAGTTGSATKKRNDGKKSF